jgi:hypothetical protein
MALSDDARNRLFIAITDQTVADEVCDAIDTGQDGTVDITVEELAGTSTGEGASLVGIEDADTLFTATDVEAALAEVKALADDATDHIADTSDAHDASAISVLDTAALFTATDVEAALLELVKYVPVALADPGTGVAIPVTRSASVAISTAGAETNTLAIPTFRGQKLILFCDTYSVGDRVVTCAQAINQAGNTIMTFGAARDSITLEAVTVGGALRWQVTSNDGVALS